MTLSLRTIVAGGLLVWAVSTLVCRGKARGELRNKDSRLDTALDDTFPASDPTATQDFAIPVNRM